ncbi:transglycosylase SLT domain-containing protein [Sulfuricaulis sp.]|uniref:transglycosylase SLT domain-containing protein n=1 Tax=Sulfuricaulis sp. TaxID=2003553 RepID=UPI0025D7483B|nr:transglycosylase SLT domain-containing protein [Sulfuricaulis sp.]
MTRSRATRSTSRKKRKKYRRRSRLAMFWPSARRRGRIFRALRNAPLTVQLILVAVVVLALWSATNWVYQVVRKPAELFFPVSHALTKMPAATWRQYQPIFRAHATAVITPDLLAALAQIEGAGNPVARTYWRWRPSWNLFELYRPASSAVGMYQFTDTTFAEARRHCIHDHVVVEDGPWHDWRSCWFNSLYTRVVPSHAVELTSAYLDRRIANTLERRHIVRATLQQKQDLAGVMHLCGAGAGEVYAKRGFRLAAGQRCGDHDVSAYLAQLNAMKRLFVRMATAVEQTE